jgi:DNA segregation ATPase FtsK/SpoIIIE, S-DNA-T family
MKPASEGRTRSNKKTATKPSEPAEQPAGQVFDRVAGIWLRFERFGWDILGVVLLAVAVITLLGITGLTQGAFLSPWVSLLQRWLGWGSFLVVIAAGIAGMMSLWHHFAEAPVVRLGRVLALEGLAFTMLAVLAQLGGRSLARAELGYDGGLIGWGLAELFQSVLPGVWTSVVLGLLLFVFSVAGFGLASPIVRRIDAWLMVDVPQMVEQEEEELFEPAEPNFPTGEEDETQALPSRRSRAATASRPVETKDPFVAGPRNPALPPLNLLLQDRTSKPDEAEHHQTADLIKLTLAEFGIPSEVRGYRVGPTVTQYAVEPGYIEKAGPDGKVSWQKVRVSQISALARDLALALSAERLRIEAPVPGQSFVGIEVPNEHGSVVRLRGLMESDAFQRLASPLSIALGKDVSGQPVVADLARMPHLLVAGTTGSGKSVCIAALTVCLAMNNTPETLRMAMLDPKMVELVRFNGLPHLLGKVETQSERMLGVLRWALAEMDNRYRMLETARTRDLAAYNKRQERKNLPTLPRIVIFIDELADLMMSAPDQTEHSLVRLAQLARATGIHLVVATQRPSTDVLTGLIKANFPARISFTVASSIDSRVILDSNGAETLLGRGDMLFLNPEVGNPQRAQGVLVTDHEVERIITFWNKKKPGSEEEVPWEKLLEEDEEVGPDVLVKQAIKIVRSSQKASASMLQRRLRVGYPRAARLIDELEELGVVGPSQPGGREREVLWSPEDDEIEPGDGGDRYQED